MVVNKKMHSELEKLGIGQKIRTLREEQQTPLEELAEKLKITSVLLSQIEDDVVPPTIATLLNISNLLHVNIDQFFTKQEAVDNVELTRVNERLTVAKSRSKDSARLTYKYHALSYRLKGKRMDAFLVEFDTETEETIVPLSHEGEEFIYCLEGEIEFISDDQRITLRPGDTLHFFSTVPHVLKGIGPKKPKAIAVLLPPGE